MVLDIYHPGLAEEIASIAGADIDVIKRINGVIAPRYGLDPVDLPPYLIHYASWYLDVPLADTLSRQILGGERHLDIMAEAGIPVFVGEREREMLAKLCDGLRSVRDGLAGLVRDNFSLPQLAAIGTDKTVNLEFVMGDQFSQITNSSIANRSQVTNSFLQLTNGDQELADALARLEITVRQSGSGDAADSFDAFVAELSKPEPKKSVLPWSVERPVRCAANCRSNSGHCRKTRATTTRPTLNYTGLPRISEVPPTSPWPGVYATGCLCIGALAMNVRICRGQGRAPGNTTSDRAALAVIALGPQSAADRRRCRWAAPVCHEELPRLFACRASSRRSGA